MSLEFLISFIFILIYSTSDFWNIQLLYHVDLPITQDID